jgi:predicted transcriptional regulator
MEVNFTPELEAKLAQSAARQGRNPEELVLEILSRYVDEESRLIEAVNRGEVALNRGNYLTHEDVGRRMERFLRP